MAMEIELSIFEDCLHLIDKFVESGNASFISFCEKWHEIMFQYIYAVQTTANEVIQTTKAILYLAKRLVCAKDDSGKLANYINDSQQISRRVGAMFLMYAIYFKQPTKQYAKVIVSMETWQDLIFFIENLPVNDMGDEVRYIFWKLYKNDAFRFTAHDYDLGLENLVDYDQLYDIYNGNRYVDDVGEKLKQKLVTVTETEVAISSMVSLEEQYNNSKKAILSVDKSAKPLPPTKIFKDIQDAIKTINEILEEKGSEDNSTTAKNALNISDKRKELKRKAAGYNTNDDESQDEGQPVGETARLYTAVRKFVMQELPESLNADLRDSSSNDED